jgi:hypothetical protein
MIYTFPFYPYDQPPIHIPKIYVYKFTYEHIHSNCQYIYIYLTLESTILTNVEFYNILVGIH